MRILAATISALCASVALVACSDGETSDSSDPSSGASSGGDEGCTVLASTVLADGPKQLSDIGLAGEQLVFVSDDEAVAIPPTIERVNTDGSGRVSLHVPSGTRRVIDIQLLDDQVYFLEEETADPIPAPELWSIPVAGGTATRVGLSTFHAGRFFGADASHVYIAQDTDQPVGSTFDRVEVATGTPVRVATSPANTGTPTQFSMTASEVFYVAGTTGPGGGAKDLYRFAKNLVAQTPAKVLPSGLSDLCDIDLGGVYTTPSKIGCGFSALRVGNHDGTGIVELVAKDALRPASIILVGSDSEFFYLHDSTGKTTRTSNLRRIASQGGEIAPIACDLGPLQNRLHRAFFPIQTEYEVIVGTTHVYWVEMSGSVSDPKWTLRRAAK